MAETEELAPSPAGPGLTVRTAQTELSGTVYIAGAIRYGETLTADTTDLTVDEATVPSLILRYQWRRSGSDAVIGTASSYTLVQADIGCDISLTATVEGCLAAAKHLGISDAAGDNKFAPEPAVTRQEMFTLLYNALKMIGGLPAGGSSKTLANFAGGGDIAGWANEAMTALVESGTISGSGGKLAPRATTTRAQMAQVLYNLLGK